MLADSWFACESLIHAVRELCNGAVHYIGLEEVRHLLEVLSQEAGIDLLKCLSTVATQQTVDFSTKVWAHLLCDSDDLAMPDLSYTFFKHALIDSEYIYFQTIDQKKSLLT